MVRWCLAKAYRLAMETLPHIKQGSKIPRYMLAITVTYTDTVEQPIASMMFDVSGPTGHDLALAVMDSLEDNIDDKDDVEYRIMLSWDELQSDVE